ncbi:MAG: DivIVA domain-containing protein [Acidimicrobiia bacterium]|jgi:DivIVA domain-containing protein
MASMDVTPQELRDIEIREAWRGYHRDDVDELLERAAATIEHLEAEAHQLRSRAPQGDGAPAPAAPSPVVAAAPAPAPAAVPVPAAPPIRTADTDVIQRTLVLAQKAADEAVTEARAKAQKMVGDAEARSQQLVIEAEANAATIAERERSKLEEQITKLQGTRDTLNADVDALERFEQQYRERLRVAIEAELDLLGQATGASDRPALHDVELPAVSAPASWSANTAEESWSASGEGVVATPAAPAPAPADQQPATVHVEAVPAADAAWDSAPAGGWTDAPTAAVVDDSDEYAIGDEREVHGDSLDDDAFFASLREAVRDDAPLGQDDTQFFDEEEDTEEHRRLFKRRR